MSMEDIYNLTGSDDPDVATQAKFVLGLTESFDNGEISAEEYQELLEDVNRTMKVKQAADGMVAKGMLITAVSGVLSVL